MTQHSATSQSTISKGKIPFVDVAFSRHAMFEKMGLFRLSSRVRARAMIKTQQNIV